jgi:alanine racemase
MVRCGLAIYGLEPDPDFPLPDDFIPALSWKTSVVQVKRIPAGTLVGTGGVLAAQRALTIAVLPVGFIDGFRRDPKHWGEVLVKGQRAPIFGQVGMYQTLIDVSQIDDVRVGDEVVLIGQQGDEQIRAEDVAERLDISIYEIISLIMPRNGH